MYDPNTGLPELIRILHQLERVSMRQEMEKRDLSELSNPKILFVLCRRDEPMTQRQIADALGTAPPTVAVSLKRMERAGLVERTANRRDMRENMITVTEKGRRLTRESMDAFESFYKNMLEGFTTEEIERMRRYYKRMIENILRTGVRMPELPWKQVNRP